MTGTDMDVVLSGGGTGGHVYPALAVASELQRLGASVRFIGTASGPEARLAPAAGLPFEAIESSGFDRSRIVSLVSGVARNARSALRVSRDFKRSRPCAVVAFGGYVAIPVGIAARLRGVPLVLHEQNSVAGMTNRFLSRWADAVAVTYPESVASFAHPDRVTVTGNPVRDEILDADRVRCRTALGFSDDEVILVVFGGSAGARRINTGVLSAAPRILDNRSVRVVHVTGPGEYEAVSEQAIAAALPPERWELHGYRDDMPTLLAAADLVVARAGATSIAEITALGIPSVLVPYPFATADHQTKNARSLESSGAAVVVRNDEVDTARFSDVVVDLLGDPARRATMSAAARGLGRRDAAGEVARIVVDEIRRRQPSLPDDEETT